MDIWAQLWPNPYPGGKVHKSVVLGLSRQIGLNTRFDTIVTMVELSGIADLCDQIETARALRDKRDEWRRSYIPGLKELTAC